MPRFRNCRAVWLALTMVVLLGVLIWVRVGAPVYEQYAEKHAAIREIERLGRRRTDRQRTAIREIRERNGRVLFRELVPDRLRRWATEEELEEFDIVDGIYFESDAAIHKERYVGSRVAFFPPGPSADDATLVWVAEFPDLRRFSVDYTNVGDEGVKQIAGLVNLEWLDLSGTDVTDASVPVLSGFAKLKFLQLDNTCVTDDGIAKLRSALPECEIEDRMREAYKKKKARQQAREKAAREAAAKKERGEEPK